MRYTEKKIVFQEIPDEVSLAFLISGCPLRCQGCHSSDSWSPNQGQSLTPKELKNYIRQYEGWITCVLFLGGEWHADELCLLLWLCIENGLKTALYTGQEDVRPSLKENLHYLKTGLFLSERGGLHSSNTNQKLFNLKTGQQLHF
jgi:anaerobic ribonucleoside-triphosphate reductase activating protein